MSTREPGDRGGTDETFLSRWSRRKAESRAEPAATEPVADEGATPPASPSPANVPGAQAPAAAAPTIELPDLDVLGDDSDYSAFLTPGVDPDLRKRALRKLFSSPKFNVFDGLDTYRDDYTDFPVLGSIVTADMRHHAERLARKMAEVLDEQTAPVVPASPASTIAATDAHALPVPETPAVEPPAPARDEENHDSLS